MRIAQPAPLHLSYCLNSHAGERFHDQRNAIEGDLKKVRQAMGVERPFGLGLRIGRMAARDALAPGTLKEFGTWCRDHRFYVMTINGFPFGRFHRTGVKAEVYRPDWTRPERLHYTSDLAALLAEWLPQDMPGSISTVPGFYARDYSISSARRMAVELTVKHLLAMAELLEGIATHTGKDICLALEPEPDCFLASAADAIAFFNRTLFPAAGKREAVVRRRIGLCLDTCHAALAFESPADVVRSLPREGIRLAKIQLSAALSVTPHDRLRQNLAPFAEPVYLHQTAARTEESLRTWPDLAYAITGLEQEKNWREARIHFHVPLHWEGRSPLQSTRDTMNDDFLSLVRSGACPHLEIETYTYDVLPAALRKGGMAKNIEQEYRWAIDRIRHGNQKT